MNWPEEIIKAGHRSLAVKYHPDKNPTRRAEAERDMQAINAARDRLLREVRSHESGVRMYEQPVGGVFVPVPVADPFTNLVEALSDLLRNGERVMKEARRRPRRRS